MSEAKRRRRSSFSSRNAQHSFLSQQKSSKNENIYFIKQNYMQPSIACLVRISNTELPYIKCFLDHYLSIGISRFYIINTTRQKESMIRNYLKDYNNCIFIRNIMLNTDIRFCFTQIQRFITEDYTLSVDVDEFLNIKPPDKIQNIIDEKYNYYEFFWLMCPNDTHNMLDKNNVYAFESNFCKPMALTKTIILIREHKMILKIPIENKYKDVNLIHYWGRTFNDVLLKSLHHQIKSAKYSCYNNLISDLSNNTIPPRFKLLALLMRCEKNIKLENYLVKIDFDMERELLKDIPLEVITKLHETYQNYKRNLDQKYILLYPQKTLIDMASILPS
jgi:hypothetical protein